MINKIKDFLKSKLPGRMRNQSDQVEGPLEESSTTQGPGQEDATAGHSMIPPEGGEEFSLTWKDRLSTALTSIKAKYQARRLRPLQVPKPEGAPSGPSRPKAALLSPELGRNIEKLLSRPFRGPIHQAFLVVLISAVTYSLGKITALSLRGRPGLEGQKDFTVSVPMERDFAPGTLMQVKRIDPFKANTGLSRKTTVADAKCEKAQGASKLPIKLVNTVVLQDSVKSLASVQVRGDRILQEVREGEQISNLAKIFKIDRLEMLVRNLESGACESIVSTKAQEQRGSPISVMSPADSRAFLKNRKMPGIENVGNKFKISKSLLDEKMKDIASILTQARAIKIQNPDGSISFKLTEMDPEGLFSYLGLQDQDTITSINGKPIYDMNEVMSLFARIKNLDNLALGIKRDGSESVQEYNIKK